MKLTRQDYILAGGQALLWITLWLIPPAIDFFIRFNPSSAFEVWKINTGFITPLAIVFTVNFYVLVIDFWYWFPICFIGIGRCSLV